ncbi:uncharacterized protein BJ171DRAFT_419559 [Polychytrium aggregatum]|uniref:uncharacterized protein n=1 Tax=Polychytrium aggregatum TaxID=110093 RepID=UPI0022FE0ED7|nr:uncharacterized protein BJ171DRAFT_419559 [Polychytrium aggregatum]KAI9208661.1 hypothetical protein BJ171DRAFT_419559 [Polychytrium aggregatum]
MAVVGYDVYYYLYLHEDAQGDPALNPKRFLKFQLNEVIPLTSDTSLFRFQMNMPLAMVQQIPVPCSVIVKDHTCQIGRHYSPISWDYDHFDLIVKKYPDGAVSQFIHSAVPGDKIEICGAFETWKYQPGDYDHIAMIAGGTGVTPCYQLIKKILKDPSDNTQISLIYANRTEADILLRSELEFLTNKYPDQIKVYHTVETGTTWSWKQGKGYINEKMVQQMVPSPDSDKRLQILVCGPEGMMRHVSGTKGTPVDQDEQGPLGGILAKLGYTAEQVYKL